MEQQSRRGLLKNAAKAAVAVTGGAALAQTAEAQVSGKLEKRSNGPAPKNGETPLFSSVISFGNLVFLAGVGAHFQGTIEEHTKHVLDELEKNLATAGSSMEKVLKVNVYLTNVDDRPLINPLRQAFFGDARPASTLRTIVQAIITAQPFATQACPPTAM